MTPSTRWLPVLLGLAGVAAIVAILGAAAAAGWPGAASGCITAGDCSCEAIGGGLLGQPKTALSSLAFIAGGLITLSITASQREPTRPSALSSLRAITFGVVLLLAGLASFTLHASLTQWAGWADLLAATMIPLFAVVHRVTGRGHDRTFGAVFLAGIAGSGLAAIAVGVGSERYILGGWVLAAVLAETAAQISRRRQGANPFPGWLLAATALLCTGALTWWFGSATHEFCDPTSTWQWHAAWHLLAAAGSLALFMQWRSEAGPVTQSGST
ncbi:MAG: hypothetical protein QNJ77_05990 [Acidimicrobiia bacterium]|nr:hypothetical protein [Acidimicrobiia bacterium]